MKPIIFRAAILASGLLLILCFPSFNFASLAWLAFVPFLLGLSRLPFRSAVLWAGGAGFLHHAGTLYWVVPTCRWGGVPLAVAALALAALSLYLALYWALFAALAHRWIPFHWARPFLLASAWVACEYLRSHIFTGFPWLLLAYSQWTVPKHLALAQLGGAYAVSFLVLLFNAAVAQGVDAALRRDRQMWRPAGAAALVLVGLTATSVFLWRRTPVLGDPPIRVSMVQANIDQYKKWDRAYENEIVRAYTTLTRQALPSNPDLILWSETSVPGWLPNDPIYDRWVRSMARVAGRFLLVGAPSRQSGGDYNAAFLLSPTGDDAGAYRKQHLVPFGEYVPCRPLLGRLTRVLNALGTFEAGAENAILRGPAPFGVTICFEGLFPHLVRRFTAQGAEFLVNVTNDGWYRWTAAPEQHFAANVLRAVENGRWLARVANTGVSGFISPRGEITARTALLTPAVLSSTVFPLRHRTFYVRWGDLFAALCLFVTVVALFSAYRLPRIFR